MTFPYSDVVAANGTVNRAILLSERSQLVAIKAIELAEARENWNEMTDSEWDDLEAYIGDAITEILTEQAQSMAISNAAVQRTSNVSTSTFPHVVTFETGSGYDSSNPTRLAPGAGDAIIQANIQFTSGSASAGYVEIRKNTGIGTLTLARHSAVGATNHIINLTAIDTPDSDDFYELVVQSNVPITIQTGVFFPHLSCKVFA